VPGRVIKKKVLRMTDSGVEEALDHVHLPDPVEERFKQLEFHIGQLERRIEILEGKGGKMKLYNTLSGKKEEFIPVQPGRVNMYVCGVTVYDYCHVGHARAAIVFDVIRRYFRYRGYEVTFVRNFTDIDDKIIKRAQEEGIPWHEVARKYTEEFYRDMDALGVERADYEPRATEYINDMIEMIKVLIEKGHAYVVDGDVYFSVESFKDYGKLSKRSMEEMMAGARVEVDPRKKNPLDFALWKSSKEAEPAWDSPWGPGRPGWHIECSVMSMKHLGETFDIHGGGADLIFPHHENEIAQSEAYTGKPFVRYWLHNGFITVSKEKMSKSLGNFFTIREVLKRFDPEVLRVFLISTHYRSPIEFSLEHIYEAEAQVDRFYTTLMRAESYLKTLKEEDKESPEVEHLRQLAEKLPERFRQAMDDDFNTALALGHIFDLLKELNRFLDRRPKAKGTSEAINRTIQVIKELGGVLGIFTREPIQWQRSLLEKKGIPISEEQIEAKIAERWQARKAKDWAKADAIREELHRAGLVLEDTREGTYWRVKVGGQ
jgi:cysteinyl-tRNA synthetase